MSHNTSIQQVIEDIENLPLEDQDLLLELIYKRRIEKRRKEIATNAEQTFKAVEQGLAKQGNLNDLMADLFEEE